MPRVVDLPEGEVINTRPGVWVRVRKDSMFDQPWLFGDYEPFASKIFCRLIEPGDTIFDVGANFGWYSAVFAKRFDRVVVHAFEPVPTTFQLLEDLIQLNGLEGVVRPSNLGLGASPGAFTVYLFANLNIGHASSSDLGRQDARPVLCEVTTLDEYVRSQSITRVDFLKADVEGHELEVFKGGSRVLSREDAPVIYFEVNANCIESRGISPDRIVDLLQSFGYRTFLAFSLRKGIRPAPASIPAEDGDYLAFKPAHARKLKRVRQVGRLFRD